MAESGIGYIRVSQKRQKHSSPEKQLKEIAKYIDSKAWEYTNPRLQGVQIELDKTVTSEIRRDDNQGQNFTALGYLNEAAGSFKPGKREGFNWLIDYIIKHRIKHLFLASASRYGRNDIDYSKMVTFLDEAELRDLVIHAVKERVAVNPFDPRDWRQKKILKDKFSEAEAESGEKMEAGLEVSKDKFSKGQIFYKPGYGIYSSTSIRNGEKINKICTIDEEIEQVIYIFKLESELELSYLGLAKELESRGIIKSNGKTFSPRYLDTLLKNQNYIGQIQLNGDWTLWRQFDGCVPEDIFWKVQKIIARHNKKTNPKFLVKNSEGREHIQYRSPYSGLFRCPYCGCGLTTNLSVKRRKDQTIRKVYIKLRCTNGKKWNNASFYQDEFGKNNCIHPFLEEGEIRIIRTSSGKIKTTEHHEGPLIKSLNEKVRSHLFIDEYLLSWLFEELKIDMAESEEANKKVMSDLASQKKAVEEKISRLDDFLEDGTYSVNKYKERKATHQTALADIDSKLKELENTDFEENVEIALKLLETLKGDWDDMPHTKRAEALKLMTERITIDQADPYNLIIHWRKPWDALSKISLNFFGGFKEEGKHARRDSNPRPMDSKSIGLSAELRAHGHLQCWDKQLFEDSFYNLSLRDRKAHSYSWIKPWSAKLKYRLSPMMMWSSTLICMV